MDTTAHSGIPTSTDGAPPAPVPPGEAPTVETATVAVAPATGADATTAGGPVPGVPQADGPAPGVPEAGAPAPGVPQADGPAPGVADPGTSIPRMAGPRGSGTPNVPSGGLGDRLAAFRLRRSGTDRMLGGVCGGLAADLGADAALLRIAVLVLTLLTGGGAALVYLAAWILAPAS